MKFPKLSYNLKITATCSIIYISIYLISLKFAILKSELLPFISGYFIFISLITHSLLSKGSNIRFQRYISKYMLITGTKFLFHLAAIIIFSFINKNQAVGSIITFGIYYIAITTIDTVTQLQERKILNS